MTSLEARRDLEARLAQITTDHGRWTYDIPLSHGVWTRGNRGVPHLRLKRMVQATNDLVVKPISQCRVLDLGCLEGLFSIEFALQGASTLGIDVRASNIAKAEFAQDALGVPNVEFVRDDARNVNAGSYGHFDVIICSGLLYHLLGADAQRLVHNLFEMLGHLLILDTAISSSSRATFTTGGQAYHGSVWREHRRGTSELERERRKLASFDNDESFEFTRPSLVNLLHDAGFSSVSECFTPAYADDESLRRRCTFMAVKGTQVTLTTSPAANTATTRWSEGTLSYRTRRFDFYRKRAKLRTRVRRGLGAIKRRAGSLRDRRRPSTRS